MQAGSAASRVLACFPGCSGWERSSPHPLRWDLLCKVPICYLQPAGILLSSAPRLRQRLPVLSFACMRHRHRPPRFAFDLLARRKAPVSVIAVQSSCPAPAPAPARCRETCLGAALGARRVSAHCSSRVQSKYTSIPTVRWDLMGH